MEKTVNKITYDVAEAAKVLGVSKSLLYREIQRGNCTIPYRKIGGRIIIPQKALDEYVNDIGL